ncbi:L-aminoadipate-semialdehyde dehydrogenase-phosphopantetheinyl transferase-like isoform X2 [Apostichopus japonicus]|uniref:L-aminoadipate-semialdehyde dehydrogenase-phosphopantetheinyl transferase-like isoform X2 n=1 Tax=Stichopus japonicus TaxID=307972 RepID=UPI003AB7A9EA
MSPAGNDSAMTSIRWAFNAKAWKPTQSEWLLMSQCIEPEEKTRIGQFYFQRDAKSSMVGRCMLRKVISDELGVAWNSFNLTRTEKGKPVLKGLAANNALSFNVAHQGDYVVLAAEPEVNCAIDVMEVRRPGSRSLPDYFDLMKRKFNPYEWSTIKSAGTEQQQLEMYFRHWCLKESYIKTIGLGLGFDLARLDFHVKSQRLEVGETVSDTELYVDGMLVSPKWIFQETRLSENYYVAVGLERIRQNLTEKVKEVPFKVLTLQELLASAQPLTPPDLDYWLAFDAKDEMPNARKS